MGHSNTQDWCLRAALVACATVKYPIESARQVQMSDTAAVPQLPRAASHAHGLIKLTAGSYKPGEKAELLPDSPVSTLPTPDFADLHEVSSSDDLTSSGSGELPVVEARDNDALHEPVTEIDSRDLKTPDEYVQYPSLLDWTVLCATSC